MYIYIYYFPIYGPSPHMIFPEMPAPHYRGGSAQVPGIDEKPMPLKKIGILGAGLMGPDALDARKITDRFEKFKDGKALHKIPCAMKIS